MKEFKEKLIGRLEEAGKYHLELSEANKMDVRESHRHKSFAGVYGNAISIVNQLAEEYNNGWIPCSERLPDKFGTYLVSRKDCIIPELSLFNIKFKQWSWDDVIAWKPLPAPYQPKGE